MKRENGEDRTGDSRFLRHKLSGGEVGWYSMYGRNIRVESDGIAYNELNIVRAILLEPILYVLMGCNMLLAYIVDRPQSGIRRIGYNFAFTFSHTIGFVCNIIRNSISFILLVIEFVLWPIRVVGGVLLAPIGMFLSAGHIYALPCSVLHFLIRGAGPAVVRKVKVKLTHLHPDIVNAGGLGAVYSYVADSTGNASYITSTFKVMQRCRIGPECVFMRGRRVFVSSWCPVNLTSLFSSGTKGWKVLDLSTLEWRITTFDFEPWRELNQPEAPISEARTRALHRVYDGGDVRNATRRTQNVRNKAGSWAFLQNSAELDMIASLADLELYYNSPLGWNKYHRMSAEGHKIRILRHDRRALSHLMAGMSSLLLYLQFRDSSHGWLGLSIELYGLVIANYALISSYAAGILVGKACDVVDAKSDRYGVIVTRAIDRGYVRGFHVPNGDWLRYKNGDSSLPVHEVKRSEVNVSCNSYVYESEHGPMIKVVSYNGHPPPFDLPWDASEAA